ncbi:flavin reductase [Achromobacter aloeverae]
MSSPAPDSWVIPDAANPIALRRAFGLFATGVTVVSTWAADGEARSFTANSFTSVSMDPPLVLVCLGKFSSSLDTFQSAETFSISVLEASQRDISNAFASRDPATKIAASRQLVADTVPYVKASMATFMCDRHRIIDAGDHLILIGQVRKFRSGDGQPLCFFLGGYVGLGADVTEIEQITPTVRIGGVLSMDGKVLLQRRKGAARWEIPSTLLKRGERQGQALNKVFERLGEKIRISVPYSVFQETGEHDMTIIFAVEPAESLQAGSVSGDMECAFFSEEDAPWDLVDGEMKQSLLRRYLKEVSSGFYGVYFDTAEGAGSVVALNGTPHAWVDWRPGKSG